MYKIKWVSYYITNIHKKSFQKKFILWCVYEILFVPLYYRFDLTINILPLSFFLEDEYTPTCFIFYI